ncbi:hypothetical protein GCM10009748_23850 [Agromyces lapidis]
MLAALVADEKTIVDHDSQVMADRRLRELQAIGEFAPGRFCVGTASDEAEELQAGRICDRTKGTSKRFCSFPVERRGRLSLRDPERTGTHMSNSTGAATPRPSDPRDDAAIAAVTLPMS